MRKSCVAVAAFFLIQIFLVHRIAGEEHIPTAPDLSDLRIPQWQPLRDDAMDPVVLRELGANRWMSKSYIQPSGSLLANLFVGWFESQRGGVSQPHSPQVCLPGSGWTPVKSGQITLATAAGPIQVNRYIVEKGNDRAVVLYWYQSSRRAVAGEWASKFWTVVDSLKFHRTDVALVRVIVFDAPGPASPSSDIASGFAGTVFPVLRDSLSEKQP